VNGGLTIRKFFITRIKLIINGVAGSIRSGQAPANLMLIFEHRIFTLNVMRWIRVDSMNDHFYCQEEEKLRWHTLYSVKLPCCEGYSSAVRRTPFGHVRDRLILVSLPMICYKFLLIQQPQISMSMSVNGG